MLQLNRTEMSRIRRQVDTLLQGRASMSDHYGGKIPELLDFAPVNLGFDVDLWQRDYLTYAPQCSRIAIAASRQSGKSTITAVFCAYLLLAIPGTEILVASRSLRQASHYVDKIRPIILGHIPIDAMVQLNRLSLELPNGSKIISVPTAQPDAGRGFSPNLVLVDEAAFAPDDLFTAVMPSVAATHGAVHMISSPNGRQGRFFEAHEGTATDVYWTQRITWKDCPRMTEEQMTQERIALGDIAFRQEFLSEFLVPEGAFFHADSIARFEDNMEKQDFSGLELDDLEDIVKAQFTNPQTQLQDMKNALDVADRVRRMFE